MRSSTQSYVRKPWLRWTISAGMSLFLFLGASGTMVADFSKLDGKEVYQQNCIKCHGTDGKGGFHSVLVGPDFIDSYDSHAELYQFISKSMPAGRGGSLTEDEYLAVTNYILTLNGRTTSKDLMLGKISATMEPIKTLAPSKSNTPSLIFPGGTKQPSTVAPTKTPEPQPTKTPEPQPTKTPEPQSTNSIDAQPTASQGNVAGNSSVNQYSGEEYLLASDLPRNVRIKEAILTTIKNKWIRTFLDKNKSYFKPSLGMKRAELIQAAFLAKNIKAPVAETYSYLDAANHPAADAIEYAVSKKWIAPLKAGKFEPDQTISRADAAQLIAKMYGLKAGSATSAKDVSKKDKRAGAIGALLKNKAMSLRGKGKFAPNSALTRAEAAVLLTTVSPQKK